MSSFDKLINECITDEIKKKKWKYAVCHYNAALKILQEKKNYTEDDKRKFQLFVDKAYLML